MAPLCLDCCQWAGARHPGAGTVAPAVWGRTPVSPPELTYKTKLEPRCGGAPGTRALCLYGQMARAPLAASIRPGALCPRRTAPVLKRADTRPPKPKTLLRRTLRLLVAAGLVAG